MQRVLPKRRNRLIIVNSVRTHDTTVRAIFAMKALKLILTEIFRQWFYYTQCAIYGQFVPSKLFYVQIGVWFLR